MTTKKTNKKGTSRRSMLKTVWLMLGGVTIVEAVWVASDFFGPRKRHFPKERNTSIVVAGPTDQFELGTVTPFPQGKFYLARLADGGFLAFRSKCTHLGCAVSWVKEENRFVCPCHASTFNINGDVQSPPAPRPLDLYGVRIENRIVKVDTSRPINRTRFSKDQVVRL